MARSTYVYLVTQERWPVAAFTVKKELLVAFGQHLGPNCPYHIWRMRDSQPGLSPVDVTDDLFQEQVDKLNKALKPPRTFMDER